MKKLIIICVLLTACTKEQTCIDLKTRYYFEDGSYSHTIEDLSCQEYE
jgi:major membrane immunogen (membrane-anchored lipoprotein)